MADVEVRILELMDRGYPVELTLNFVQQQAQGAQCARG